MNFYPETRIYHRPRLFTLFIIPQIKHGLAIVMILDDMLDKGVTAEFVKTHLKKLGARAVMLAVLVDKQTERLKPIEADYACLKVEDGWLAGMGMDDTSTAIEGYRWGGSVIRVN